MRVCPVCRSRFPAGSNFCPYDGRKLEDLDVEGPDLDPMLGQVLDKRYRIESKLGSGGMGDVYAARHVVIDKPVAVKVLREEYSRDPRQAERFIREARAASRIGHPNIVDVTDFGRLENNQIFFVMEYLYGITLGKELKVHGALTARRTLNLSIQICHALDAAHAKGIVHRDLKPENIFIVNPITQALDDDTAGRHQDVIKLLDFGIAKITWDDRGRRLTKVGSVFGTPQYMSPEQAAGKDTDHRGDIYSLGCIIYEMLTGEVPFLADTFMGTLTKQMFENPVPPRQLRPDLRIPAPVERVIMTAMSKEADNRHQTMKELAVALEGCFRHDTGPAQRAPDPAATPQVVLMPPSASLEELTDGERDTVHLLEKQEQGQEQEPRETLQPTPPGARLVAIVAGVGLFIGLTAGGIYLVLRSGASPPPAPTTPDAAVVARSDVRRPDTRAVVVDRRLDLGRTVRLTLRSVPAGASIYLGDRLVGQTPETVTVTQGQEHRYVFAHHGYHQEVLVADAASDRIHVVRLRKLGRSGEVTTPYGSTRDLRNPFRRKGRKTKKK